MRNRTIPILAAIAGILTLPIVASAAPNEKDSKLLDRAPEVLRTLAGAPDSEIPRYLLDRAECIAVFPAVTKGAFIVGGEHGRGVATCRTSGGAMSDPAFLTVGGASVGWQIGGEQTELVMLVMNKGGKDHLFTDSFKVGAEVSAAAGPVGRTAEAAGDPVAGAGILSWSRSKGLFAGASLEGAVINSDEDANERLYGRKVEPGTILAGTNLTAPAAAEEFVKTAGRLLSPSSQPSASAGTSAKTASASNQQPSSTQYGGSSASNEQPSSTQSGEVGASEPYRASSSSAMPRTASPLPRYLLGGLIALGVALALRLR